MSHITLLAMAPSGDTLFVRDAERVWLIPARGSEQPRVVDEEVAAVAVAKHGFQAVDQNFESWQALDDFVQELAERVTPARIVNWDDVDREDVERLIRVAKRWAADGQRDDARRAGFSLLRLPIVRADAGLNDRLVTFVESLDEPTSVSSLMHRRAEPPTPRMVKARARWHDASVAA